MARASGIVAGLAFVGVAAAALYWGPDLISTYGDRVSTQRCTVTSDGGTFGLTAEQANNAAIVSAVGLAYGYGEAGVTVAIATAIQESGLRNIDYGDRDSIGLFQQRPSQGWGTVEEIMDPRYSASKFYAALATVDGWEEMRVTDAAQAVQRSGFPEAYADHEAEALAWASAFTGGSSQITCDIDTPAASTSQAFSDRLSADLGPSYTVDVLGYDGDQTLLGIRPLEDTDVARHVITAWAISTASTTGVTWVDDAGSRWGLDGTIAHVDPVSEWVDYPGVRLSLRTS